jgi:CubicO group peptidase (beta-lactamase class C family)
MRKIYITGFILKVIFFSVFYFMDFALSSSGSIATDKSIRSEYPHFTASRISNDFSDIEDFYGLESNLKSFLNRFDIKGASVAIARDGRLVYAKGIGFADINSEEIMEPRHMFRIASVSKLITAITILKMREFGLLDLDDNVFGRDGILNDSIYLNYTDPRIERITVRHLLNHSAGWHQRFGDQMFMPYIIAKEMKVDMPVQTPDIIRFALKKRMHFNPGSGTSYSNLGYAILGEIVAAVSGMSYEAYVQKTILLPLGIRDMRIGKNLEQDRFENEVRYYEQNNASRVISIYNMEEKVLKSYGGNDIESLGAAGGWIASPAELLKLIVAIDDQSGVPLILSDESIQLMTDAGHSGNRVLGWTSSDRNGNFWRTGTFAGTSALVMRQNNGLTWAVLLNSSTYRGTNLASDIRRAIQPAMNRIEKWPEHDLFYYTRPQTPFSMSPVNSLTPAIIKY